MNKPSATTLSDVSEIVAKLNHIGVWNLMEPTLFIDSFGRLFDESVVDVLYESFGFSKEI